MVTFVNQATSSSDNRTWWCHKHCPHGSECMKDAGLRGGHRVQLRTFTMWLGSNSYGEAHSQRPKNIGDLRTHRYLTRKAANMSGAGLGLREIVCTLSSRHGELGLPFVQAFWNPANYIMCPRCWTWKFWDLYLPCFVFALNEWVSESCVFA